MHWIGTLPPIPGLSNGVGGLGVFFKKADQILTLQTNINFYFKGANKDLTLLISIFKWRQEKLEGSHFILLFLFVCLFFWGEWGRSGRGQGGGSADPQIAFFLILLKLPCPLVSVIIQETKNR